MKPALFCLVLFLGIAVAKGQPNPCSVTVANAPELRGFKLGMTADQVKSRARWLTYPQEDETAFLETTLFTSQIAEADRAGLALMKLSFLDHRLVTMEVRYNEDTKWESPEQFAASISKFLNIPNHWERIEHSEPSLIGTPVRAVALRNLCGEVGFAVVGVERTSPVLFIYTTTTKNIRDQRRARLEENKRRTFKP